MTLNNREKMLAGLLYRADRDGLPELRESCARKLYEFNNLPPERWGERPALLKSLLAKTGDRIEVNPPFRCDYGWNIQVGENFYANYNLVVLDVAPVTIGDNCLIAPNVAIYTAGHPLNPDERRAGYEFGRPVTIGDNVWIGGNSVILPGISIGDNSVIGAGSIVTRDIPANVLAVGNPCRILRPLD